MEMQIQEIPLTKIRLGFNHRDTDRLENLSTLMSSIKTVGKLIHPITVEKDAAGAYKIVSGYRRFHAIKNLGWKTIPSSIVEFDNNIDRIVFNHDENAQSAAPTVYELGTCYSALQDNGLNIDEIATKCSVQKGQVRSCLSVFNQIPIEHRDNVVLTKNKQAPAHKISSTTAQQIMSIRKRSKAGITKDKVAETMEFVRHNRIAGRQLKSFLINVNQGLPLSQSLKKIGDQKQVNMTFMADGKKVAALERKFKQSYITTVLNFLGQHPEFGVFKVKQDRKWIGEKA